MLKHGFQHLWEAIIEKEHLHIEYEVNVDHVYRVRRGSWLCTRHHEHCQYYKFVVWTPELRQSIHKFKPLHADEQEIFSRTTVHYYSTSLVDSLNVHKGLTSIDYMFSNVLHKREHSVWAQRDSYAALRGHNGTDYQNGNYPSGKLAILLKTHSYIALLQVAPNQDFIPPFFNDRRFSFRFDNLLLLSFKKLHCQILTILLPKLQITFFFFLQICCCLKFCD